MAHAGVKPRWVHEASEASRKQVTATNGSHHRFLGRGTATVTVGQPTDDETIT
jgi:hypothetical protein